MCSDILCVACGAFVVPRGKPPPIPYCCLLAFRGEGATIKLAQDNAVKLKDYTKKKPASIARWRGCSCEP